MMKGVTATVFGGMADQQRSAYDGHLITDQEYSVALPYFFARPRPVVRVVNPKNGKALRCLVSDIGPWYTHDPYWTTGERPRAERHKTDDLGRYTNRAGIDLSPGAARYLGIDGTGLVDWEFV
jgi:hypothetical protein